MDWKMLFSRDALAKGKTYFHQKKVVNYNEHGNTVDAVLLGANMFDIRITDPGKDNVKMYCTCPYSRNGFYCVHMAAVMFQWEENNQMKEETDLAISEIDRIIPPAKEGSVPFYHISRILEGEPLSRRICREAKSFCDNGQVTLRSFERVDSYSRYVRDKEKDAPALVTGVIDIGEQLAVRPMEIRLTTKEIKSFSCTVCGKRHDGYYYYYQKQKPALCSHLLALLIEADRYTKLMDPGDYTDSSGQRFLDAFNSEKVHDMAAERSNSNGTVSLEPRIVESGGRCELNFRIGNTGKMYIVKNLTDLHTRVVKRQKMELGKTGSIDFATEDFNADSMAFYDLIDGEVRRMEAVEEKMQSRSSYYYDGTLETGKGIPFTGSAADTVYELMQGRLMDFKSSSDSKAVSIMVGGTSPKIRVNIEVHRAKKGRRELESIEVGGYLPLIIEGVRGRYFISEGSMGRLSDETWSRIRPFMRSADRYDRSSAAATSFLFTIGHKQAPRFYYNVLPQLRDDPAFIINESESIEGLIPEKADFAFYLDVEDDIIICETDAEYGPETVKIRPLEEETPPLAPYRDVYQEMPVLELLDELFAEFDSQRGAFELEDSDDARYDLLKNGVPRLMAHGAVHSTDAFSRIKIKKTPSVQLGVSVESDLLNLDVRTTDMSYEELAALLLSYRQKKKYHRLKNGAYIDLEENESLDALIGLMESSGADVKEFVKGKLQIPLYRALYLDKMLEGHDELVAQRDRHYRNLIRNFKTISDADFDTPSVMEGVLRPYQEYGYKWLRTLETAGFGGILADDMGLGKTLQILALLQAYKEQTEPASVTAPGEIPQSRANTHGGSAATAPAARANAAAGSPNPTGTDSTAAGSQPLHGRSGLCALVVCPASVVYNWIEEIRRFAPGLDPVAVTGTRTERRKLLQGYRGYDILVTSYDLLKRDIDLYEELQFSHEILDEAQFIKNAKAVAAKSVKLVHATHRFALTGTPIENRLSELWSIFDYLMPGFLYGYEDFRRTFELPISKYNDERSTEALKNMIAPFILRRKKKDVLKDLPDKIEEIRYARMEDEQRKVYDGQAVRISRLIEEKGDINTGKIEILAELTRIRQICCDPHLLFADYSGESAKRQACLDLVSSAVDGGHKMLLFSQFTSMLALLEDDLKEAGISYYKLTGETSKEERMRLVKAFNTDSTSVFLISLKAGGTGLNLTGADIVIHYDPWWNLAAQDQATDRAHRIGQTKDVTVFKLIAKDTIEEKIVKLQETKKELADAVLSGETKSLGAMSKEELLALLS